MTVKNRTQIAMHHLAKLALAGHNADQLADLVLACVGETLDVAAVLVTAVDGDTLRIDRIHDRGGLHLDASSTIPFGRSFCALLLDAGYPALVVGNAKDDSRFTDLSGGLGLGSYSGVPLYHGDGAFHGALCAIDPRDRVPLRGEAELLALAGRLVMHAVETKLLRDRQSTRLAAEEALRESEHRHRQMFQRNRAIKLIIDPASGAIVDANPAACEFYGYTLSELTKRNISDINVLSPDEIAQEMQEARTEQRRYFQFKHRLASGELRDVEVHSGPLDTAQGTLLYSIVHDITDRKRAEEALLRSEERFRVIFESAAIGLSVTNVDGSIAIANRALADLVGRTPEEMQGRAFTDITHPDDAQRDWGLFQELLLGKRDRYQMEKRYIHKDGHVVWVRLTVSRVVDSEGKSEFTIAIVEDISERKRAEEALRDSEARFRAIFDSAPIGIELAGKGGRLLDSNAALQSMLGYSGEELRSLDFTAITHPEDIPAENALDQELIAGARDHYQLEKRHVHKDGHPVWTRLTATLVNGPDGEAHFALGMVEDITERKRAEEALAYQALHDMLTDLPNRALLLDRLEQALLAARRLRSAGALLLMDLDRFKEINDTFGHHYGDLLLQQLGHRLAGTVRESDTVARLGGDEFALVLPAADREGSMLAAQRIIDILAQPFVVEGHRLAVEASIGIALFPEHSEDTATLLRQADVAMYVAKRDGGGFAFYAAEHDVHSPNRVTLVGELRRAIEDGQLYLQYQPKLDLATRRFEGVEALVRWQHPERGFIAPDEFIGLAENTGLIKPLTLWVLDEALRQCRAWHDVGLRLRVSVNTSPRTLQDPELVQIVADALARWRADASWLELEITEGAIMADPDRALEILTQLHDMGVGISIDDFGTGYSSLAYLQRLPVDEIKIDKSFILDMAKNEEETFIAQSVIDLGHNLGMDVVAEGVENQRILDLLAEMGCDQAQGYHLSRPLPASEIAMWMRAAARRLKKSA